MGIHGLKKILKKYAEKSLREVDITFLKGSTIAIDSSILLYKYRYVYSSDNFHIQGFTILVNELRNYNINPVFVFDGKPPEAKQYTLNKRIELKNKLNEKISVLKSKKELLTDLNLEENLEEYINDSEDYDNNNEIIQINKELEKLNKNNLVITKKHSEDIIQLLISLNINFIRAPGEAEEYCSFLQKNKIVDYVLTEDTDSLTFGANKVLFNNGINKKNFLLIDLELALSELGITYFEFIDFCILSGCDYTCKIPKIGPVNALKLIKKYSNIETIIGNKSNNNYKVPEDFNYLIARELFTQNNKYSKENIKINRINNGINNNNCLFINNED